MPRHLVVERGFVPVGQPFPQGAGRIAHPVFAVHRFKPAFKRVGGLFVKLPQQHGLPVVPGPRPHATDIADGQHGQQVQPFARFHRLGKVAHGAGVADIAFLRHVGHQQMIAHQPFHRLAFLGIQPQPGGNAAGHLRANDRMILGAALADVVQKQRNVDDLAVHPGL